MPGKVFISYRRDDDPNGAARIRDALTAKFGQSSVFMDVDDLLAGLRFDHELAKALATCDVFLAIIGPRWTELLNAKTSSGDRDYVREEIAEAIRRKIVVIPVRVGREGQLPPLPRANELPHEIRDLVHYQKHDVAYEHFGRDGSALVNAITAVRRHVRPEPARAVPRVPWGWIGATTACVLLIGWIGVHQAGMPVRWPFAGDAKPILEPSTGDLAAAAKKAVLKEQADAAEQRRREEAEARRKAEEQAKADRQRLALQAEQERQRKEQEGTRRDPIAALAPDRGTRLALVISNESYPTEIGVLANPHKDGAVIAAALEGVGFEKSKITVLKDADQPTLRWAIADFTLHIEEAGPDAVAFLYYSGQGAADRTGLGENYLIPVGAKITLAKQLPILGVGLSEITKALERVPAKARFVVFDACRDVAFTKGGLIPERKLDGMIVAFATRPGETVDDNNIYASVLASILPTPGLRAEEVFKETQLKVANLTKGRQIPWTEDGLLTRFRFK
jgi:hypothetical protein